MRYITKKTYIDKEIWKPKIPNLVFGSHSVNIIQKVDTKVGVSKVISKEELAKVRGREWDDIQH